MSPGINSGINSSQAGQTAHPGQAVPGTPDKNWDLLTPRGINLTARNDFLKRLDGPQYPALWRAVTGPL